MHAHTCACHTTGALRSAQDRRPFVERAGDKPPTTCMGLKPRAEWDRRLLPKSASRRQPRRASPRLPAGHRLASHSISEPEPLLARQVRTLVGPDRSASPQQRHWRTERPPLVQPGRAKRRRWPSVRESLCAIVSHRGSNPLSGMSSLDAVVVATPPRAQSQNQKMTVRHAPAVRRKVYGEDGGLVPEVDDSLAHVTHNESVQSCAFSPIDRRVRRAARAAGAGVWAAADSRRVERRAPWARCVSVGRGAATNAPGSARLAKT